MRILSYLQQRCHWQISINHTRIIDSHLMSSILEFNDTASLLVNDILPKSKGCWDIILD